MRTPRVTGSFSGTNGVAPAPGGGVATANLQNETAMAMRQLKQKEWEADQDRQRKKARREQAATGNTPISGGGGDTTPGTPGGDLPGMGERKISVKESKKQAASKIEEAASHRAANATANMMMGGFGGFGGLRKKKKTYSWMTTGGTAPGGGGMGGPARPGPVGAIDTSVGQINTGPELGNLTWTGQRLGVWREDGERGKAIQIRDWVGALEGDGRVTRKGIIKAYLRMK